MRILHQTLAMVALVVLVIQPVRIGYARWIETRTPGRDAEIRSVQAQILSIGSLDDLTARHEALRKQADELRRSLSGGPSADSLSQLDREPFRSESLYEGAITTWEASASELRQCRFYWFVALGMCSLGLALYKMVNRWLGTTLLIAAFVEFTYWTSPSAFIWSRVQEVDRLLTSQFVLSIISLLLLLLTIVILKTFQQGRIEGSFDDRPTDEHAQNAG
jgi:hypothetical protein